MPYQLNKPPDTIKKLPKGAQKIWIETFNAVEKDTKDEDKARQAAWANVKKEYKKEGDEWVPKAAHGSEGMVSVNLTITKASLQKDGSMRWCATCSDTEPDGTGERTSLALFQDWIERSENGQGVEFLPPPRVPFLGLSHYPSFEGAGEAGTTEKMYVDGKQFKASGFFQANNELGVALFEAVRSELETVRKGGEIEQPIRISAAWWDLEHSHGKFVFTRRSLLESCPMCAKGSGDKQYLKGQLDHFAATRVPINPRTSLGLEEKSMAKVTRKDDATSIVGEELAEDLEEKAQELVGKSETEESAEALVVKAEDPAASSGQVPSAGSGQAPEQPESEEAETEQPDTQKMSTGEADWQPMGGATSFAEAETYIEAEEKMDRLWTNWDIFDTAFFNIMNAPAEVDKVEATKKLVGEFNERVQAIKANMSDAFLVAQAALSPITRPQPAKAEVVDGGEIDMSDEVTTQTESPPEPVVNDPAAVLGVAVKATLEDGKLTRDAKLAAIQDALNAYAGAVKAQLDAVAPPAPGEEMAQAIEKSMGALAEKLDLLIAKLDNRPSAPSALPQQKSYAPTGPVKPQSAPQLPVSPQTGEPSALRAMIERSVGMHQ